MQLIYKFQEIFKNAQLPPWLRPHKIIVIFSSSGIIGNPIDLRDSQFLPNTMSIDGVKKSLPGPIRSLSNFYSNSVDHDGIIRSTLLSRILY